MRSSITGLCIALGAALPSMAVMAGKPGPQAAVAGAIEYRVVHHFGGNTGAPDGRNPVSGLTLGFDGDLYGTTHAGGAGDDGTVYRLRPGEGEKVVHSFSNKLNKKKRSRGYEPEAHLVLGPDGNLYGTTSDGPLPGTWDQGYGTIFRITPDLRHEIVHRFSNDRLGEGVLPRAPLVLGPDGHFYGVTSSGISGQFGHVGVFFRYTVDGQYSVLHAFGCCDAHSPSDGLTLGADGLLYGVSDQWLSTGVGVLYRMSTDGTYTDLHTFPMPISPTGPLAADAEGVYGVTWRGGASDAGTVFKYSYDGVYTVIHELAGGRMGEGPSTLMKASDGFLYGTTVLGGGGRAGTVFRLKPDGSEFQVVHRFKGPPADGTAPAGRLYEAGGKLWGVTRIGGVNDAGVLYMLGAPQR